LTGLIAARSSGQRIRCVSLWKTNAGARSTWELMKMAESDSVDHLAITYVAGVTLSKWTHIWKERRPDVPLTATEATESEQVAVLRDGRAQLAFVRLPIDANGLNVIPLYREVAVAVAAKDHAIAAADSLVLADLAGESVKTGSMFGRADFDLVAAGVGILIVPHSIARLQSRRDLVSRPVTDASTTQIAVAWLADPHPSSVASLIEEFIGIVRGRTARSSRSAVVDEASAAKPKRSGKGAARSPAKPQSGKPGGASFVQRRKNAAARKKRRPH
jgi:hypothetical protein